MSRKTKEKLYTLKEACELLSISTATGRNWIKSGRLVSVALPGEKPVFEETSLFALKTALTSGTLQGLKGRRNKSYVAGKQTYHSYINKTSKNHTALKQVLAILEKDAISPDETLLLCLLRNCAEQLLSASGIICPSLFHTLLDDLVSEREYTQFQENNASLCKVPYMYDPQEDTLGFLYLSLSSLKDRKSSGSYYTPAWLAKRLVEQHLTMADNTHTFLDPSCGTGIFLLQLPMDFPLKNLHGSDLNPVSVTLTRINLALKYRISTQKELEIIRKNITVSDFLATTPTDKAKNADCTIYDIILGNPPWGAKLSTEEKKNYRMHFSCATDSSVETFDLFIEQSLAHLSPGGILSFILPESVLTVKAHTPIRELLLRHTSVLSVEYLGEVFEQVHCPSIILTVTANTNRAFFKNVTIHSKSAAYSTEVERMFHADCFHFLQTDKEYLLLLKINSHPVHTTLVDKANFALGIVTGNNSVLLHSSPAPGLEPVIRGSDISKYHINSYSGYLSFQPEQLQQTAPEYLYRASEKLFYRFINKQLIFAYDNTGLLSLNSCNILIPHIEGLSMKYILAVLNSSVAQFVFEKKFHSVKVLRSHLEQIPIPLADAQTQEEIVGLVNQLIAMEEFKPEYQKLYEALDKRIAELFGLSADEYKLINS